MKTKFFRDPFFFMICFKLKNSDTDLYKSVRILLPWIEDDIVCWIKNKKIAKWSFFIAICRSTFALWVCVHDLSIFCWTEANFAGKALLKRVTLYFSKAKIIYMCIRNTLIESFLILTTQVNFFNKTIYIVYF